MGRKIVSAVMVLLVLAVGYADYDYTLRDDSDVKAMAEAKACAIKSCGEKHALTKEERTPFRQALEYTWASGVVALDCGRPYWIAGDRECHVMP